MMKKTNKKIKISLILIVFVCIIIGSINSYSANNMDTRQVIRFAGDNNYPPYEYMDGDRGIKGFDVDIIRAIGKVLDVNIEIMPMEWEDAIIALENGEVDGVMGMTKSTERLSKFAFTQPTIKNQQFIFVNKDNVHINDLSDLSGLRVAYQKADCNEDIINKLYSTIAIPMRWQEESLIALNNGEVDAAIGNRLVGIYHLQRDKMADNMKIVGESLYTAEYGPAVLKENTKLLRTLERGLKEVKANGTYSEIYKKWFGEEVSYINTIISIYKREILAMVFIILLIILFLYLYNQRLQMQVERRTKELELANQDLLANQKEIYNLAYYDIPTSLPNRIYFVDKLKELCDNVEEGNIFAILFLDIDKFKHINDTLGHNAGDYLLNLLGIRLNRMIREGDMVAKAGGDEYFILMNNIKDSNEAIEMAEIIIEDFKIPYYIQDYELYLTTSIGIAMYPEGGDTCQDLIRNSDLALYKAKELGGNTYYLYGDEIVSTGLERMILLNQLRQAIENDELILYYQPQIDIITGKIKGLEALIRWEHPEKGLVFPDTFIPLAEESGLIIQVDMWVLMGACIQAKKWVDEGLDIIMSVNISAKKFQHQGFLAEVNRVLEETGLEPKNLTLEITETTAILDMEHTMFVLDRLKKMGIAVAIDDFGTGYSSLSYLNQMGVSELKIDRTFIQDIENNEKNRMISNTIIALAKQLGLKVTAEGVENLEQLEILQEMKCDIAQGYHFSKPITKDKIEEMMNVER